MINYSEVAGFMSEGWQRTEVIESVSTEGTNTVTTRTIYQGKTAITAAEHTLTEASAIDREPVWCIRKTVMRESVSTTGTATTDIAVFFADGNIGYRNRWSNRQNLTYKYLQ